MIKSIPHANSFHKHKPTKWEWKTDIKKHYAHDLMMMMIMFYSDILRFDNGNRFLYIVENYIFFLLFRLLIGGRWENTLCKLIGLASLYFIEKYGNLCAFFVTMIHLLVFDVLVWYWIYFKKKHSIDKKENIFYLNQCQEFFKYIVKIMIFEFLQ